MEEAEKDVITTEEAQVDLELRGSLLAVAVLGLEKKVDLEAKEALKDRGGKVVLKAKVVQKNHQVLFKEKAAHQDVQKVQLINQQADRSKPQKVEGREKVNIFKFVLQQPKKTSI